MSISQEEICWFCKKNTPDEKSAIYEHIYVERISSIDYFFPQKTNVYVDGKNVSLLPIQIDNKKVKIPRCKSCKKIHKIVLWIEIIGGIVLFISVPFVLGLTGILGKQILNADMNFAVIGSCGSVILWTIFWTFIGYKVIKHISQGVLLEEKKDEFPELKDCLANGWKKVKK
jgi:hypothetical protein